MEFCNNLKGKHLQVPSSINSKAQAKGIYIFHATDATIFSDEIESVYFVS